MNKQELLKEAYNSTFDSEFEKVALVTIFNKKVRKADDAHWDRVEALGKSYRDAVSPYQGTENIHTISSLLGAAAGGVTGAKLTKSSKPLATP